jgi:hypothetical protein
VRLLAHCDEKSARGRLLYYRRLKSGWRFDRKQDGRWASVTDQVCTMASSRPTNPRPEADRKRIKKARQRRI